MGFIEKIFGTHSEHELKRIYPIVDYIESLDREFIKNNISPGGSADLLALTFFLYLFENSGLSSIL